MEIEREKLINLGMCLRDMEYIFKGPIKGKFYYAAKRNQQVAEDERKLTFEAYPVDPKFFEYEKKRTTAYREAGVFNDLGLRKLAKDNEEAFNALQERLRKLAEEYKDAIEAENKMSVERDTFLKEVIDVKIYMVSLDEVPEIKSDGSVNECRIYDSIEPMVVLPEETPVKAETKE